MKSIEIDRSKALVEEPHKGHNRFHPDVPPVLEVEVGEEVVIQTRSAADNQLTRQSTSVDAQGTDSRRTHPMTGPVFIKGAEPGDLLEVEFLEVMPSDWGYTGIRPGRGYLKDQFHDFFLAIWDLKDGWATSAQVPGVRIPGAPFMGIAAVAPSHEQVRAWARREAVVREQGGIAAPPDPGSAVPSSGPAAKEGLRTMPPRENGGNMDVKQMTGGACLLLPVAVEGALFSTGDAHFAQGDGEACLQAVEMDATVAMRFRLLKGEAERRRVRFPRLLRTDYFADPRWGMPRRFLSTMGLPIREDGSNAAEDLNVACRNALLQMIEVIQERGFTREQAYVICSVAVDLRISQVVDVPNYLVSALLPEDIFVQ